MLFARDIVRSAATGLRVGRLVPPGSCGFHVAARFTPSKASRGLERAKAEALGKFGGALVTTVIFGSISLYIIKRH